MPTFLTSHHESTLAAEEDFLAIVCADEELLRAEFDAIIAAEWPSPPPDTPADYDVSERSPGTAQRQPKGGQARLPNQHVTTVSAGGRGNAHLRPRPATN